MIIFYALHLPSVVSPSRSWFRFSKHVIVVVIVVGIVVVVLIEDYYFLINIIVGTPGPWPLRGACARCNFLLKMCKWPQRNDYPQIWVVLLLWFSRGTSSQNRLLLDS